MTIVSPNTLYIYVRVSSIQQVDGDGLRRQLDRARAYAKQFNLEVVELQDRGRSARSGRHLSHGELGHFMKLLKRREIKPGDVLYTESLDRLSRESVDKALYLFLEIINAKVTIVTDIDRQRYDKKAFDDNSHLLQYVLTIFGRGSDESRHKEVRLGQVWAEKRARAKDKHEIMTKRCPAWLETREIRGRLRWRIKAKNAELVQRIFKMRDKGLGNFTIAKILNREGIRTLDRGVEWDGGNVCHVLRNRAVIGVLRPETAANGADRQPTGDVIEGYYVPIVDRALFDRVQAKLDANYGRPGRKGRYYSNLFTGICVCNHCGCPMHYVDKGAGNGRAYLICSKAKRHGDCNNHHHFYYKYLEQRFLENVAELPIERLDEAQAAEERKIENQISEVLAAKQSKERALRKYQAEFESDLVGEGLKHRMLELDAEITAATAELQALTAPLAALQQSRLSGAKRRVKIASLISRMQTLTADNLREVRTELADLIKGIVKGMNCEGTDGSVEFTTNTHAYVLDADEVWRVSLQARIHVLRRVDESPPPWRTRQPRPR